MKKAPTKKDDKKEAKKPKEDKKKDAGKSTSSGGVQSQSKALAVPQPKTLAVPETKASKSKTTPKPTTLANESKTTPKPTTVANASKTTEPKNNKASVNKTITPESKSKTNATPVAAPADSKASATESAEAELVWTDLIRADVIIELTDENYDNKISKEERILVFYHAPWCSICHTVAPQIAQVATELSKDNPKYRIGFLDCSVNEDTAEKLKLDRLPWMKLYIQGRFAADFKGKRTVKDIKDFVLNAVIIEDKT